MVMLRSSVVISHSWGIKKPLNAVDKLIFKRFESILQIAVNVVYLPCSSPRYWGDEYSPEKFAGRQALFAVSVMSVMRSFRAS